MDDEPAILELAQSFLEEEGDVHVVTCTSALYALGMLSLEKFDAIVSDYQMPDMDGIEFLKALRSKWPTMPFVLFTGRGREEVAMEALRNGADSYIMKGGDAVSQFKVLSNEVRLAAARRDAEEAVHYNLSRFNLIMGNVSDIILIIGEEGLVHYISPSVKDVLGYEREEILGRNLNDLRLLDATGTNASEAKFELQRSLNGQGAIYSLRAKDGSVRKALVKSTIARQGDENVIIATAKDVTRIMEMESLLSSRERLFASVLDHMPIAAGIADATTGEIVQVNRKAVEVLGLTHDEVVGRVTLGFGNRDDEPTRDPLQSLPPGGMAFGVEVEAMTRDGEKRRFLVNTAKIVVEDRTLNFFMIRGEAGKDMPMDDQMAGGLVRDTYLPPWNEK